MASLRDIEPVFISKASAVIFFVLGLASGTIGYLNFKQPVAIPKPIQITDDRDPKQIEFEQDLQKLTEMMNSKLYKKSEEIGLKLLQIHPRDTQVLSMLSLSQRKLGQFEKAQDYLERAIQFEPGQWILHHNLGNVLFDLGKTDEALKSFEKALELAPPESNTQVLLSRARVLEQVGRYSEAKDFYSKATEQTTIDGPLKVIIKGRLKKLDVLAFIEKGKR